MGGIHLLSPVIKMTLVHLIHYRDKIVKTNLKNSFPSLTVTDRRKIMHRFYAFLGDLVTETIWMFSASERRIRKHLTVDNPELINDYFAQGKNVVVVLGHFNSWEILLSGLNLFVDHQIVTIYVPLTDRFLDHKFQDFRTRFGMQVISKKVVKDIFDQKDKVPKAILFGADQSPSLSKDLHWTTFLNQETAVVKGPEKYAMKYDCPVVFLSLQTRKRGFYTARFTNISSNPREEENSFISETHVRLLEEEIIKNPQYWLWSHRRWKKKRERSDSNGSLN